MSYGQEESSAVGTQGFRHAATVPAPRRPIEPVPEADQPPTLGELVAEAAQIVVNDSLPPSGFIVGRQGRAMVHRHAVWRFGPFALLAGGFFGTVHASTPIDGAAPVRALRRHEKKCSAEHWSMFRWLDPELLGEGCGEAGIGIGLGPEGPTYCPFQAGAGEGEHQPHIPVERLLRSGLRELAARRDTDRG